MQTIGLGDKTAMVSAGPSSTVRNSEHNFLKIFKNYLLVYLETNVSFSIFI